MKKHYLLIDFNHNQFRQYYYDRHPVVFRMKVFDEDDD